MAYGFDFFDEGLDRVGTDCEKWDAARRIHGEKILPLWVADMDFKVPQEVTEAIMRRAAHPTYGYTEVFDKDVETLCAFWERRHGIRYNKADVVMLPCVVTGLKVCIQAFTKENDKVVIQPPVYGPFFSAIEENQRRIAENPLVMGADGRYHMNLSQLEELFREGARLMLLCSPHNPVSRAYTREELADLISLCKRYDVTLVADEIHADFVYKPQSFVPALALGYEKTVSLCAASKTFNLAGLQQASLIVQNEEMLKEIKRIIAANGIRAGNIFALAGTREAYLKGDAWLDGLMRYLEKGRDLLLESLKEEVPKCRVLPIEATYLAFLDLRAYGYTTQELADRTLKAGVMFTEGTFFSNVYGEGFLRFNFACPHRLILQGVQRLKKALEARE